MLLIAASKPGYWARSGRVISGSVTQQDADAGGAS
ncbi:hypothetical protein SOVF_032430 isoform A [Spinacia oleracea]|nr:hypothetical protein SOVF_032430 isoform A [Spinacia oleracea]